MVIIESAPNGAEDENNLKPTEEANTDGFETASDGDVDREEEESQQVKFNEEEEELQQVKFNGEEEESQQVKFIGEEEESQQVKFNGEEEESQQVKINREEEESQQVKINGEEEERRQQKALTEANAAKTEGNKLFGSGQYEDALLQYELALQAAADMPASIEIRSICHANKAACFSKLGRYEETIKECNKALELNPAYMKALIRRGEAHEKLEHFEEAVIDMKKIVELDPSNNQARRSIVRLEPLAAEKREKMKEEMIGKLKEMGNSVLGRFGMSIDNFKTVKDPTTGSYSVSFQK